MTATAEPKTRAPKAIAVSKLIDGKVVTTLAKSELDKLRKARNLCAELSQLDCWANETGAACDAIDTLIVKAGGKIA